MVLSALMKPPKGLHPLIVAREEAFCRAEGIDPEDFWAIVQGKKAPTAEQLYGWLETYHPLLRPSDFLSPSLPREAENSTLSTMSASPAVEIRRGRPLSQRQHPFVVALLKARLTVLELSHDMKRPASSVRSWYKHHDDRGWRPIPKDAAKYLQKRLGVPLAAWHRIAD